MLERREFDLVINVPKNNEARELKNDYMIRRAAVDYNIPLFTNIKVAKQFIDALVSVKQKGIEIKAWEEYR
jgi:carbamoyl-phosphate synthase large subunit